MCVLEILVLKIFKLRDYFERFLCWLDHWLSCMLDCIHICVCTSRKTIFKRNLNTSLISYGSIEKAPASSVTPRHLLDRSRFFLDSDFLLLDSFLDTSAIKDQFLDTYLDRYLDTSRYLHLSRFTSYLYKAFVRSGIHFSSISLSIHLCFSPKTLSSSPNLFLKDSSSFFQVSPYLVSS